jgi:hypothetical protein
MFYIYIYIYRDETFAPVGEVFIYVPVKCSYMFVETFKHVPMCICSNGHNMFHNTISPGLTKLAASHVVLSVHQNPPG